MFWTATDRVRGSREVIVDFIVNSNVARLTLGITSDWEDAVYIAKPMMQKGSMMIHVANYAATQGKPGP